jgi:adenylate kinase family enzyme
VRRVAVIGCPGAGKSTFALRLGALLALPVVHLDRLYWRPGWVRPDPAEWLEAQREALRGEAWIADGMYLGSLQLRLALADTVFFLDYPPAVCLARILRRAATRGPRPDMAPGCRERLDPAFLRFVWRFPREHRPRVLERLRDLRPGASLIVLPSPRAAARKLGALGRAPAGPGAGRAAEGPTRRPTKPPREG